MDLVERIREAVVGRDTAVQTPFGLRRLTYADYGASGRCLSFIEEFIHDQVLPLYANTHTEASGTGLQTTRLREDARAIIRKCVGANEREHAVIFAGNGATGTIDRLIAILGLRIPKVLDDRFDLLSRIPIAQRPVVFVGPYEHHSNELPWRETIADVIEINESDDGHIDLAELEDRLVEFAGRPLKIGSFSAGSNVTGIISDTKAIAGKLHEHGALSFWDFGAAAPYVDIDMGSEEDGDYKDAVFISPHKFIGGPGTPGVLVARKDLLDNEVPAVPGGGTVQYVSPVDHTYLADPEHREEGGTPAIIGSIKAGLVFKLKNQVGIDRIRELEHGFIRRAIASWSENANIDILGNHDAERLSIASFVIRYGEKVLHHNYVVALLNDLFGIQARGGCSCAGPYGHRLLGIDLESSSRFEEVIATGCEVMKPGWVRLNFNYFIREEVFEYIVDAVHLIAEDGWRLLSRYRFDPETAVWSHERGRPRPPVSLRDVDFESPAKPLVTAPIERLSDYLEEGRRILAETPTKRGESQNLGAEAESLRWFATPVEIGR
ncbi:MAG: aminotransferase class V-fold PLP-dependent enzyme [Gemmatimonadota bacterium]